MAAASFYQRHLTEGDDIRLIEIQPGETCDVLRATIQYHDLHKASVYEALSYTWGSSFNTDHPSWSLFLGFDAQHDLYVDGELVKITDSLYRALKRLRKVDKPSILWVDAICIDQSHDQEKSWQIQKMREIYERSLQVFLWLGPSDNTSDLAMRTLRSGYRHYLRTRSYMALGERQADGPPPTNEQEFLDLLTAASMGKLFGMPIQSGVPIPDYPIRAVADLLNRAYWGRGWCWQEFTVATKISIICGEQILEDGDMCLQVFLETWDRLKEIAGQPHGLDHRPWSMMETRRSYRNVKYFKEIGFVDSPNIEVPDEWMPLKIWAYMNPDMTDVGKAWLLRECVSKLSLKALLQDSSLSWLQTNQYHKEDQVFALMGMATDAEKLGIMVDCALTWEKVYTQVCTAYLKRGDLWFLNYCQGTLPDRLVTLPSWVPDWSQGYRGAPVSQHYIPGGSHLGTLEPIGQIDFQGAEQSKRLRLRGALVDEVAWVSAERTVLSINQLNSPYRVDLYRWIRSIVSQCRSHSRRDIWTVMIAGSTNLPLPEDLQANKTDEEKRILLDKAFDSILAHDVCTDRQLKPIIESFLRCLMQATGWRCIFRTKGSRLGISHIGIEEDDRAAAFMGSTTTFILRSIALTSETPRYRLLCESYVSDILEDEQLKARAVVEDIILE